MTICEVCGREKGNVAGGCFRATVERIYGGGPQSDKCYRLGYEREKARADAEHDRAEDWHRVADARSAALMELRAATIACGVPAAHDDSITEVVNTLVNQRDGARAARDEALARAEKAEADAAAACPHCSARSESAGAEYRALVAVLRAARAAEIGGWRDVSLALLAEAVSAALQLKERNPR